MRYDEKDENGIIIATHYVGEDNTEGRAALEAALSDVVAKFGEAKRAVVTVTEDVLGEVVAEEAVIK
jgi:hypothetical protein